MNYEFLIYIDFKNNKKSILEYKNEYCIYDYTHSVYDQINWQKNGLTEVLNILDQDTKEIICIDNEFLIYLREELAEINMQEFYNARMVLNEYGN